MPLHSPKRYNFTPDPAKITVPEKPIRLFGTAAESIVDGPGIRFVVFVQGCPHHCPGCHNPGSHDPAGGVPATTSEVWAKIAAEPALDGVTFSGGEPFLWAAELALIGKAARDKGLNVMTYTGYTYEKLLAMAETDAGVRDLLTVTNYLMDGPFILAERDLSLHFRGSRNQRMLDITGYPNVKEPVNMDEKRK